MKFKAGDYVRFEPTGEIAKIVLENNSQAMPITSKMQLCSLLNEPNKRVYLYKGSLTKITKEEAALEAL